MSVLVTGGAGYIGSHMVLQLRDEGEEVVVLDNLSTGFEWAVPEGVPLVVGDIADQDLVAKTVRKHHVDSIIHFAGSIVVPESITDPLGYYDNNTVKTRSLIESAVRMGVPNFIFSSTAAVYGMPDVNPVTEDARLDPISPYGTSKMMSELMLRDTSAAFALRYVALRYFNVAGADPEGRSGQSMPKATHLIKVASQAALGQRPYLEVYGTDYPTEDGTCIRDYIHVSDLANAHSAALSHLRRGGDSLVLNCGYGRGHSVMSVIDSVQRAANRDFEVRRAERRPGDPAALVAGADRIRDILGWKPARDDLDTIVSDALAWEDHLAAAAMRDTEIVA